MLRTATAISLALALVAQPALAQDAGQVQAAAPAAAAPAPAKGMSFAEKMAIAAGLIGAGVLAVKALKGSGQSGQPASSGAASLPPQAAPQPAVQ